MNDPVEAFTYVREHLAERKELRAMRTKGVGGFMPWPPCPYQVSADWEQRLHDLVGAPWPCPAQTEFWKLWPEVIGSLEAKGYVLGRGAFAGWGDGESALVRAVYCLVLHLRPKKIVETGVARGITTRFVLEALARNGSGHLWSIDLPPIGETSVHSQIAAAVPDSRRGQWTYVRGSSRRRLVPLLREIEEIELFVHDSRHTQRNLLFELHAAWRALRPGGALVVDDVDLNCGYHSFIAGHSQHPSLVCPAEPLRPDHGRQDDTGVFGVTSKRASGERTRDADRTQAHRSAELGEVPMNRS